MTAYIPDPPLAYFMGAYFHQDFDMENGTPDQVVDAFCRDDPHLIHPLIAEIAALLQTDPNESELSALAGRLGCAYAADHDYGTYRAWFESIEAQARAYAAEHPGNGA